MTARLAHNFATLQTSSAVVVNHRHGKRIFVKCASVVNTISGWLIACSAIFWSFVKIVCDLEVSPIFPPKKTLCPASPSLQWVPWASVPHLIGQKNSDHRYYGQLRLPNVHLWLVRCSLSSPDTLYCSSLFVVPCGLSEKLELSFSEPGVLPIRRSPLTVLYKETSGSPKFPGYPYDYMPCSQTPVMS